MHKELPPDRKSSVPEIIPPTAGIYWAFKRFAREAPPVQRLKWAALPIAGLFGFLLWGFNEFTTLRGWVHVLTSRLVLVAMFGSGALIALMFVWVIPAKKKRSMFFVIIAAWVMLLFGLDRIAPKPSSQTSTPTPAISPSSTPLPASAASSTPRGLSIEETLGLPPGTRHGGNPPPRHKPTPRATATPTSISPQPAPTVVVQLPSIGNLRQRAITLSNEIMEDLYMHGWIGWLPHQALPPAMVIPIPNDAEGIHQWTLESV
jgi:hypothetical protein